MAVAFRMKPLLGLAGLISLLSTVAAETKITYPDSDSMTFYAGDKVTVKYVTDYAGPKLNVFCYKDTGDGIVNPLVQTITTGTGSKTVTLDIGSGVNGCWFNIQNNNDIWGVNSPVWNYKQSRPSQQSSPIANPIPVATSETPPTPAQTGGSSGGQNNGGSDGGSTAVPSMTSPPESETHPSSTELTVETAGSSGGSSPGSGSGSGSSANGGVASSPQPTSGSSSSGGTSNTGTSSNGASGIGSGNGANAASGASANNPFVMTINGSTTTLSPIATASPSANNGSGENNSSSSSGNGNGVNGSNGTNGSSGSNGKDGESSDNSGLSTGAKAGIGAAVAICAALAIAGLVFFLLARRKQKRAGSQASELPAEEAYAVMDKSGGRGGQGSAEWRMPPMQYQNGGAGPYEMDIGHRPPELHTLERPQEIATPIGGYQRDEKKW